MDEFFERLKEQAYKAKDEAAKLGKQVYAKTNNVISQTKLSFAINETDSKIKDVYSEMGKKLYEAYLISGNCIDELKEECEQLDALFKEKEALREKMSELKESVKCPECGKYNKSDARIAADAERSFLIQLTTMLKSRLKKHIMAKRKILLQKL